MSQDQSAISPTRAQDYPEWYQQVIRNADMAENSPVRGCMVIKPWGYGIWERLQRELDNRIKETGHQNAYFPLFIPLSFLEKEAQHVAGFAKECAVVTHHRLEEKDGKLIPAGELDEPLIVRPTSETIIGEMFKRWVQSYRDLPLLINQWANVVRWEMRTRLFLRTTEFLWQEGHTAHASEKEALDETLLMLEVYRKFMEEVLALPVITGYKTPLQLFPGAVKTFCVEAMMQDKKALQAGTSHYLGQNFAKGSGIEFVNEAGEQDFVHTTSWGVSTRLIGALIMTHGDDDGLRVPPRVAPYHAVVLPVIPKDDVSATVMEYCEKVRATALGARCYGEKCAIHIDRRDIRGGEKNWAWIKKGVPVRLEAGPKDREKEGVMLSRRDKPHREKIFVSLAELPSVLERVWSEIQDSYFNQAKNFLAENTVSNITNEKDFKAFFTPQNEEKPEIHGGFVKGKWCEDSAVEEQLAALKVSIRCIPLEQDNTPGKCVFTGRPATKEAIFAKAY